MKRRLTSSQTSLLDVAKLGSTAVEVSEAPGKPFEYGDTFHGTGSLDFTATTAGEGFGTTGATEDAATGLATESGANP